MTHMRTRTARPAPARKAAVKRAPAAPAARPKTSGLGALPEWHLTDLYPALNGPEVKRDLDRADADCLAFEEAYKGRLAAMAESAGRGGEVPHAVERYQASRELIR